jgi:hypothetical protein
VGGDLVLATGLEAIAQDVDLALQLVQGGWFLDGDVGTPYFEQIWRKAPNLAVVRQVLIQRIEGRAGVGEVTSLEMDMDARNRALAVRFTATTDFGELSTSLSLGEA